MTPEEVSAMLRDPEDPRYPCQLGVYCDRCGTVWEGDFVVSDDVTGEQRLQIVRDHVSRNLGWSCGPTGDFCPKCKIWGATAGVPT